MTVHVAPRDGFFGTQTTVGPAYISIFFSEIKNLKAFFFFFLDFYNFFEFLKTLILDLTLKKQPKNRKKNTQV